MIAEPIPEDDVFDRLQAALRAERLVLHRGVRDGLGYREGQGRYYTTDGSGGAVRDSDLDLEGAARQRGGLKVTETMVPSHGAVEPDDAPVHLR